MTLLMLGGWESGTNLDTFSSVTLGAGSGVVTTYRRGAQYSMCFTNNTDLVSYSLPTPQSEIFMQVAVIFTERTAVGDYAGRFIRLMRGTESYVTVNINSSGQLALYRGDSSVLLASGTVVLAQNRWYNIEVRYKADSTNGIVQVKIDGALDISYTGITCPSIVARWSFESGALTTDSVDANTLTNVGTTSDTTNYKEGSGSIALASASSQYQYILNENLSSNFPAKSTNTQKLMTICCWAKFTTLSGYENLWEKSYWTGNSCSMWLRYYNANVQFLWGYGTGQTNYTYNVKAAPSTGRWYHLACRIDGLGRVFRCRTWDDTAGSYVDFTQSAIAQELRLTSDPFAIGAEPTNAGYTTWSNFMNGNVDEVCVFDGCLSDTDINYIRQNSAAGITPYLNVVDTIEICSKTNYTLYLDDVVINDTNGSINNSWPDHVHVLALGCRSDTTTEWVVPSYSPSGWEQVQLLGASQITTGTTNAIELFGLEPTPVGVSSIVGVQSLILARAHPTYPTITTLHSLIKVGSTVFESTDVVATKVYVPYFYSWEANPLTGTTWTTDDLGNLKIGVKAIR